MRSELEALKIEKMKQRNDSVEKYENNDYDIRKSENKLTISKYNNDYN